MNHNNDAKRRKRSYETHTSDLSSHAYYTNVPAPSTTHEWHDMDYTSPSIDVARFGPTSAPVQYNTTGMMSFSPVDYARHEYSYGTPYADHDNVSAMQTSGMYRVGPFRYTELANMDGDTASVSQESIYSRSTRIHSLTDSERRDSQTNSILSNNDMRRESEGFERVYPVTSIESEHGQSELRATEPLSLDLTNHRSVEECVPVPCMTSPAYFAVPRPQSNPSTTTEQLSPLRANHSGFTSPTTLTFQEPKPVETSKVLKPRRAPRSKSAHASVGDIANLEKASKLRARQAHSLVERKYRDNLNLKITQLHQTLQNANYGPASSSKSPLKDAKADYFDDDSTFISPEIPNDKSSTGSTPTGTKVRKSDVLSEAMNYVNTTEFEMRQMSEEIIRLSAQVKKLEKLVRCEDCTLLKQMVTLQVEKQQGHPPTFS